jgi:sporulation protein YlmC with PRC-barrel domain
MPETPFTMGAEVFCSDGACGELKRVVIDPAARAVTHLVVEPKYRKGHGRLVPLELVDDTTSEIRLRCTKAEFGKLDPAEETDFRPGSAYPGDPGYGSEQGLGAQYPLGLSLQAPFYELNRDLGDGTGVSSSAGPGRGHTMREITYDSVPAGEVEVRRGEHVRATDGEIGRVAGLVIDPGNHEVTHVLLQEGHLWGSKEVTIPIGAVTGVEDGVQLSLTKKQVEELPPVDIRHPAG